jgi:hypothetical protein
MSAETKDVERILQFKFRSPTADTSQLVALIKSAMPFYQASGVSHARLLRNVDDPSQFIQVLEYKVPEMLEMNRQAIAGDAMNKAPCARGGRWFRVESRSTCTRT